MGLKMVKAHRAWFAALAGFGALAIAGGVAGLAGTGGDGGTPAETVNALTTVTPAAVVSPEALSEPEGLSYPSQDYVQPKQRTIAPGEPVEADPVRVFTGDGDCLNVRPSPGLTFQAEPFTCVPEETLLWLYGPAQEADGETWRYALGSGWVATRYTKPSERPDIGVPGAKSVTFWQEASNGKDPGMELVVRQVNVATGEVSAPVAYLHSEVGIGSRNPEVSPSGKYIAFANNTYEPSTGGESVKLMVASTTTDTEREIANAYVGPWGKGDRLLVTLRSSCTDSCTWTPGWYDATTDTLHRLDFDGNEISGVAWAVDGQSVFIQKTNGPLLEVDTATGTAREVADSLPENAGFYEAVPSPSGRQFFIGGGFGPINILDVTTGAVTPFALAEQREIGGKCGGTFSRSNGWIDEKHIFYHERSSAKRQDGITIGDIQTGERRVLPFFNVQDLSSPAPGLLSFATWAGYDDLVFSVTFVVDLATGDSLPVYTGAGAAWGR